MDLDFILASSSPRRRELIQSLGIPFRVIPSEVDETATGLTPQELVMTLANRKAAAVQQTLNQREGEPAGRRLILGVDTVVVLGAEIIGKPQDAEDARRILERLSGRTHRVLSGLTLRLQHYQGTGAAEAVVETAVRFNTLSPEEIRRYVATGEPLDKAGAYGIQGRGGFFVSEITGCYFNVVGLPVQKLYSLAGDLGLDLLEIASQRPG